jgi:hypothetical protein
LSPPLLNDRVALMSEAFISGFFQEEYSGGRRGNGGGGTLRAVGAHQLQQFDHLGPGPCGLGFLSRSRRSRRSLSDRSIKVSIAPAWPHGHAGFVPLEEAGDEQVVLEQAAPATPFQLAQRAFV